MMLPLLTLPDDVQSHFASMVDSFAVVGGLCRVCRTLRLLFAHRVHYLVAARRAASFCGSERPHAQQCTDGLRLYLIKTTSAGAMTIQLAFVCDGCESAMRKPQCSFDISDPVTQRYIMPQSLRYDWLARGARRMRPGHGWPRGHVT